MKATDFPQDMLIRMRKKAGEYTHNVSFYGITTVKDIIDIYKKEDPGIDDVKMLKDFSYTFRPGNLYYRDFVSSEQRWLAFVMKKLYNRIWRSGDWDKVI